MTDDTVAARNKVKKATQEILKRADDAGKPQAGQRVCEVLRYSLIGVTPEEAFAIAKYIAGLPDEDRGTIRALVLEHAAIHGDKDSETRQRERIAFPFIDRLSRECGVQLAHHRPQKGDRPASPTPPQPGLEQKTGEASFHATPQHAQATGSSSEPVELSQALFAIWRAPDAEARWHGGEDIFATCRIRDIEGGATQFVPRPR
ncbi:MAG: hypothetical protein AAGC79_19290 [Pseudomonadota bacterium]